MEDLGEAQNLYGSLSVVELQNVVDRREAVKAKMREKNHVEKLSLEWSESSADNSQTEKDILDELRPRTNIKELQITGYRGTKFPDWLADPLFLKLVELSLSNCKDCDSLPALGQLPSLKFLSISGMHRITEVTEEFYGSWSSKKPFNSLEYLEFEDMPEWKQWHVLGNGEFPTLEILSIKNCPELSLERPIQLSSLKRFEVIGSPKVGVLFDEAQLFTSQLEGMNQIVELFITGCNSVTSLPFNILPSTLKHIRISGCQKLKLEASVGEMMFVEYLIMEECDSISPELFPRAGKLIVERCHNLTRLLIPTATESVTICNCENLEILSGTQMTELYLKNCEKLKCLPQLLPSLKILYLYNCPEIESFPEGGLPFNLQILGIVNCNKLVKTLSSQVLKSLNSLDALCIGGNLSQIQSMLEEGHLSHLTSLQCLEISHCRNLQSLSESALPSTLSKLTIINCPNLQSLPVKWMLSCLSYIYISNCPLLQPLLEFEKGEYWPNIAQFPNIIIDQEWL